MSTQKLSTRQILEQNLQRTAPASLQRTSILLHNVRSMHNVGAAFRSADAFGISRILLSGFTPAPPRPEISKTAIGAEKHVEWEQLDGKDAIAALKQTVTLIGVEQTSQSVLLPDYQPPVSRDLCLLFGNEVTGIDEELFPHIDAFVEIPQYGHKHSLNVSVSIGVVLYAMLQKFW
ncbi:MAG: TrmH family RNA methyltransferase [Balneolaceae bacterium]|nr:TrmH family RNA methyltransferase [Balneolaceae bacterium]